MDHDPRAPSRKLTQSSIQDIDDAKARKTTWPRRG